MRELLPTVSRALPLPRMLFLLYTLIAFRNLAAYRGKPPDDGQPFPAVGFHARSAAVRRGSRVTLCASPDPQASLPSCGMASGAASSGWGSGWVIFTDSSTLGCWTLPMCC